MDIDDDFSEYIDNFKTQINDYYNKDDVEIPKASKLIISVMSATCYLGNTIDLQKLCNNLKKNENIIDIKQNYNISRKISSIIKKKIFYNQTTLYVRPWYNIKSKNNLNILVNLKLFRNGKCQMCGLRSMEDGIQTIKILLDNIVEESIGDENNRTIYNLEQIKENFKITLINSDFYIGFKIDRHKLYNILLKDNLNVNYDPCVYQGVNLKYFINYELNKEDTGKCLCPIVSMKQKCKCLYNLIDNKDDNKFLKELKKTYNYKVDKDNEKELNKEIYNKYDDSKKKCKCELTETKELCKGKGEGYGKHDCKKITISIFQSGYIIVTGKCTIEQLNKAYDFIIKKCHDNFNEIYQQILPTDVKKIKRRKITLLVRK